MMKAQIKMNIMHLLQKFGEANIKIFKESYKLFIFIETPEINLFEVVLFLELANKRKIDKFLRFDPYKEGLSYCNRLLIILDSKCNRLILRDTLFNETVELSLDSVNAELFSALEKSLNNPNNNLLKEVKS